MSLHNVDTDTVTALLVSEDEGQMARTEKVYAVCGANPLNVIDGMYTMLSFIPSLTNQDVSLPLGVQAMLIVSAVTCVTVKFCTAGQLYTGASKR